MSVEEKTKAKVDLEYFLELTSGELVYYWKKRGLPSTGNHGTLAVRCYLPVSRTSRKRLQRV